MLETEIKTISSLKQKVLDEYEKLCKALIVGKEFNYNHILDALNFIEVGSKTSNPKLIQQFLLNE